MNVHKLFENKIVSAVRDLPTNKMVELIIYAEYLKKKENWRERFQNFLSRTESKLDNITDKDIYKEIRKTRAVYEKKTGKN